MKKMILCVSVYLLSAALRFHAYATENDALRNIITDQAVRSHIWNVYDQLNFGADNCIDFPVFEAAYRGYLNLRQEGRLAPDKQLLGICDLSKSANTGRFWIIDLREKKLLYHTYVAHGQGSGDEYATRFSNIRDSHQSSLGFYITGDTYIGAHGLSLRLNGMDKGFNSAALERGIVVHGADYVSDRFIRSNKRLGRSWGCPAVPAELSDAIISRIKDGHCLFVYYPQKEYLAEAYWLNKKIEKLPEDHSLLPSAAAPQPPAIEVVSADSVLSSGHYYQVVERSFK